MIRKTSPTKVKKKNNELINLVETSDIIAKQPLFIQYRGKVTEQFAKNLPINVRHQVQYTYHDHVEVEICLAIIETTN